MIHYLLHYPLHYLLHHWHQALAAAFILIALFGLILELLENK